jgi:hypothetical protein
MMNTTEGGAGMEDEDNFSDPGYGGSMSGSHLLLNTTTILCLQ